MAIRMTVTYGQWGPSSRETEWRRPWIEQQFTADLHTYHEMEFLDEDIEHMMAAQILGIDEFDLLLEFYREYTEENGFRTFLSQNMEAFYEALQEQGYGSFNDGDFSREQFALILASFAQWGEEGVFSRAASLLEDLVDSPDDDYFAKPASEKYKRAVEEKVEKLISELKEAKPSEAKPSEVSDILDELMLYIDWDEFDFKEPDITPSWGGEDYEGTGFNAKKFAPIIKIFGNEIYEWERLIRYEIYDPITFEAAIVDYGEHSESYWAPAAALEILKYFGETESVYNEDNVDSPEPPEHPESDPNGDFGVLYQRRKWDDEAGSYSDTEFEEEQLVPYEDEEDIRKAIELSTHLFTDRADERYWVITPLEKIAGEWHELGEYDEDD